MICIEFYNNCDINPLLFACDNDLTWKQRVYFDQEIGYPQYPIDQEINQSGDEDNNIMWSKWQKRYTIKIFESEPLLDGLTVMPLCDHVFCTSYITNEKYKIIDIDISEIEWDEKSGMGTCEISFAIDSMVSTACCNAIETECGEECDIRITTLTYDGGNRFSLGGSSNCEQGFAFVYYKIGSGEYILEGTYSYAEFVAGLTIDLDSVETATYTWKVVAGNHTCENSEDTSTVEVVA